MSDLEYEWATFGWDSEPVKAIRLEDVEELLTKAREDEREKCIGPFRALGVEWSKAIEPDGSTAIAPVVEMANDLRAFAAAITEQRFRDGGSNE